MSFKKLVFGPALGILFLFLNINGGLFAADIQSEQPIVRAAGISFDENRSIMFVLNEDNTISAFDFNKGKFILSRDSLPNLENYRSVLVSPDGSFIAFYLGSGPSVKISIFKTDDFLKNSSSAQSITYSFPQLTSGIINWKFSDNSKILFVAYGENSLYFLNPGKLEQEILSVGDTPTRIELDKSGHLLVVNEKSENLSIIDISKKDIVATVKLGSYPKEILFNEKTNYLYVSHVGSDNIYVIDVKEAAVVGKINVGNDPTSLAYDKDSGDVFIANNSDGTLSVIAPDFTVKQVDLQSPAYFASSPLSLFYLNGEKKLFILNSSTAKLLIYDATKSRIEKEMNTDFRPVAILGSEKLNLIFIQHFNENSIFTVDGKSFEIKRIPAIVTREDVFFSKPQGITINQEENKIFVSNVGNDTVTVIDGDTQKPIAKIKVGASPESLNFNPQTKKLYAVSPVDNLLAVIDTTNKSYPTKTISIGRQPRSVKINETTNLIYIPSSGDAIISVVDGVEDKVIKTISLPVGSFPLVNSINEQKNKIYVALYGGGAIAVIDGKENRLEKQIAVGQNPIWVSYIRELNDVFVTIEGERKVVIINPETNEIIQTIQLAGIPYRIFFDKRTNYVYINYRHTNLVTVLSFDKKTSQFKIIKEETIPFWGETDARPYNMAVVSYKTNIAYFTSGINNSVVLAKDELDSENIRKPVWYATINADGSTTFSQTVAEGKSIITKWVYGAAAAIIVVIGIVVGFLIRKKKQGEIISQ